MHSSEIKKRIERKKLAELTPYKNNPRKNEKTRDAVAVSIAEVGYDNPIIVDEAGVILSGHTRLKALQKLGEKEADVLVITGMTEAQKKKFRLLANKTAEIATWDFEVLAGEIKDLDFSQYDFDLLPQEELEKPNDADPTETPEFEMLSLTLHAEQKAVIEECMKLVQLRGPYDNPNKHGNQIFQIIQDWAIKKMKLQKVNIETIKPYANNPRLNDVAVEKVMQSINQCGYIAPIIVDEKYEILAGHTRLKALKLLGYTDVDCVRIEGLTEKQKKKFRILDNKLGELSEWDHNLLAVEKEGLDFEGVNFWEDDVQMTPEEFGNEFSLPEGDQSEWRTMTFALTREQKDSILFFIQDVEPEEDFENKDETADKIYEVCKQWAAQRT